MLHHHEPLQGVEVAAGSASADPAYRFEMTLPWRQVRGQLQRVTRREFSG